MTKNITKIYLQCLSEDIINEDHDTILVTIETFIILFIYNYLNKPKELDIYLICNTCADTTTTTGGISISVKNNFSCKFLSQIVYKQNHEFASLCNFPVALTSNGIVIAGLCGVSRCLIKNQNDVQFNDLLGFKGACLLSPSESSIWTKFCEIDIIECVKRVLKFAAGAATSSESSRYLEMPEEIVNFESHLSQPIRAHNVYKLARELANNEYKMQQNLKSFSELSVNDRKDSVNLVENSSNDVSLELKPMKTPRINKKKVMRQQHIYDSIQFLK